MFTPENVNNSAFFHILMMFVVGGMVAYGVVTIVLFFKFMRCSGWNFRIWKKSHPAYKPENKNNSISLLVLVGTPLFFFLKFLASIALELVRMRFS